MSHLKRIIGVLVVLAVTQGVFCRPRIHYGDKSDGYPFMVFLSIDAGAAQCGGTLIKPNWVLTAAHCVVKTASGNDAREPETLTAYLGSTKEKDGYAAAVKRVIVHEQYNQPVYLNNDVAVLELAEDVPEDKGAPVQLAETLPDDKYAGQEALAMGWGTTENNRVSPVLLEGNITMVEDSEMCYPYSNQSIGKVCSRAQRMETRIDRGDSGGPILVDADGQLVQIGLVSYFVDARSRTVYSGFTSTGYYHDWIEEHIAA